MQFSEMIPMLHERTAGMSVLYVEDDETIRITIEKLLNTLFPSVVVAENGKEGLEKFHDKAFDLVISDILMPKMNGIEMVKEIKKINSSQSIIIMSAHDESYYLMELINIGVSQFLLKPLQLEQIFRALMEVVTNIYNEKQVLIEVEKNIEQDKIIQRQARLAQMGEMISMIAHQWRQPLNTLGLILQKTKIFNDKGILTTEKIDNSVESSMQIIHDMSNTIDEFMNIFKVDDSKVIFNFQDVLTKIRSIIQVQLEPKKVELIFDVDPDLQIYSYQNELFHVLLNLISNASDAFDNKEINNKVIRVKAFKNDGIFECSVRDNAGGIPEEIIDKVFIPYFTTKEQGKGTGLGLDMSKRMVEKSLHGSIAVQNEKDGAVFTIQIKL